MNEITKEKIVEIVNSALGASLTKTGESLIPLGLDSIKFIQLVVTLEEEFDCEIPDSRLMLNQMDNIDKIYAVLTEACEG